MRAAFVLKDRSDQQLLSGIQEAVGREREDLALVIAHLVEMERRELALPEGCSSLSKYCINVLHLSEWQAYRRVDVARVARKFPVVLDMLADGLVNVTAVFRLGPSLTEENHRELLKEAVHKSREQIEELVARLRPKPPVPSTMRKLPGTPAVSKTARAPVTASMAAPEAVFFGQEGNCVGTEPMPPGQFGSEKYPQQGAGDGVEVEPVRPATSHGPAVSPLAPEIYKIQLTVNAKTRRKLKQLQEMMGHRIPNGDVGKIIELGIDLLYEEVSRQRFGKTKHPRNKRVQNAPEAAPGEQVRASHEENGHSRHIPTEVKRDVWERDQGSCAFVSKNGRRCSERNRIEYHHVVPFAWGGESTVQNIQLRCRAHNAYEGDVIFGKFVKNKAGKNGHVATGPRTSSVNGNGNRSTGGPAAATGPRTS